jgi:hypothetical protein
MLLAIDPGPLESAYVKINGDCRPVDFGKIANHDLKRLLYRPDNAHLDHAAIEMIASYGMTVGADVFETCVWIGRFYEILDATLGIEAQLIKRQSIKVHFCGTVKAKDQNVKQALVDRFAPEQWETGGKGTKANPGPFYGFRADMWQAYALAVYAADQLKAPPF